MSRAPLVLAGRTCVVTGAGSGIGRALALHAASQGMALAICDIAEAGLKDTENTLRESGASVVSAKVDIANDTDIELFARHVAASCPPPALLFANAGILRKGSVSGMPIADWRALFDINVIGTVRTVQAFAPAMAPPAQIVLTGSTASMASHPDLAAYCGAKHALWPIADMLREELQGTIGVSLLMPGAVSTKIFDHSEPDHTAAADSISPERAADIAFAGAIADQPIILTHPNFIDRARARFESVLNDLKRSDTAAS